MSKMLHVERMLQRVNWLLLAQQKTTLVKTCGDNADLCGLVYLLDALQDAAEREGFPVVWPEEMAEK